MKNLFKIVIYSISMALPVNGHALKEQCPSPSLQDSAFWAQQYVGADLLRTMLEEFTYNRDDIAKLVGLWDSSEKGHGEFVSQIIAGPFPSAVIPLETPLEFYKFKSGNRFGNYIRSQAFYKECLRNQNCPLYINHSQDWLNENISRQVLKMNTESGIIVVTSASNDYGFVEEAKAKLARAGKLIIVASLNPRGRPSDFTNFSDAVTIAAPSDSALRSYSFSGTPKDFSGTSGATPLVTGSLAAFTLISGYKLKITEAIHLLQKTAIPLPALPSSAMMGAGMLNAYKIGAVAQRLKQKCQGQETCVAESLFLPETYQFEGPHCAKKDARKAAFLNPTSPAPWENLAKAFPGHELYSSMAKRTRQSDTEVLAEMCRQSSEEGLRMLSYLPSRELLTIAEGNCALPVRLKALELFLDYADGMANLAPLLEDIFSHSDVTVKNLAAAVFDNVSKIRNVQEALKILLSHSLASKKVLAKAVQVTSTRLQHSQPGKDAQSHHLPPSN